MSEGAGLTRDRLGSRRLYCDWYREKLVRESMLKSLRIGLMERFVSVCPDNRWVKSWPLDLMAKVTKKVEGQQHKFQEFIKEVTREI